MKVLKPRYTSFIRVVPLDDGFILLENYEKNLGLEDKSLLYKIDRDSNVVWEAIVRSVSFLDVYYTGSLLKTYDGTGTATLDPNTEALTDWLLTK